MQLPDLRIGLGYRYRALTVFPLFCPSLTEARSYRLAIDELGSSRLEVGELGASGVVPWVSAHNRGDEPVLFLEGQQLLGAKQNRVVNTTVMVAPRSKTRLPVSCVEQGRWRSSRPFAAGAAAAPAGLRGLVKASVTRAVATCAGWGSDQQGVWQAIERHQVRRGVHSGTRALEDVFRSADAELEDYSATLAYVPGAAGVALAVGDHVASVDLFDRSSTCSRFWSQLVRGVALDAVGADDRPGAVGVEAVSGAVEEACGGRWIQTAAVGLGDELRGSSATFGASALVLDGDLIHFSAVANTEVRP